MKKLALPLFLLLGLASVGLMPTRAVTLEQIISREHPSYDNQNSTMTVGRDGRVYLCIAIVGSSYVLRIDRDGGNKGGSAIGSAAVNATANAQGIVAAPLAHLVHQAAIYNAKFEAQSSYGDFLVSDALGFNAPAHVEAGESGDFYFVDPHRDRILRLDTNAKILKAYSIPRGPTDKAVIDFRVNEKRGAFYVHSYTGPVRCVSFDGQVLWSVQTPVSNDTWNPGNSGGFDVDEAGNLYVIGGNDTAVQKYGSDGAATEKITLQMGDLAPVPGGQINSLRVYGNEIILKRRHPTELFQRYDLTTGQPLGVVETDHERLTASYDKEVWTAGDSVPFSINFDSAARLIKPQWHVWLRPLNAPLYQELKRENGHVLVPPDAAGIYQVKVTPETLPLEAGLPSEYVVRGWVEVRRPDSRGTLNVMSPQNRVYFAAGETIPLSVLVRAAGNKNVPLTLRLSENKAGGAVIAESKGTPDANGVLALSLPSSLTGALRPGAYVVRAEAADFTAVPQYLTIGQGDSGTSFLTVRHGDYGETFPSASFWSAPDVAESYSERESRLGFNLHVDRLGIGSQMGQLNWGGQEAANRDLLSKKLAGDPLGVAPDKVQTASVLQQVMAAYAAHGISEMAIPLGMDAGLPLGGAGFDNRKPDELKQAIQTVTQALLPYPSFRGWSWNSNWWIYTNAGANAAKTPEEKAAYIAALKKAGETGAWDDVLERVSNYRLNYAVDAQQIFKDALHTAAPNAGLVTASAGTYRNVNSYPPISFQNVDEVDLQGQFEQIYLPYFPMHAVDFEGRPGKAVWGHPEIWDDSGTGEQVMPALFSMVMRGADGVGLSGSVPPWYGTGQGGAWRDDPRLSHFGTASVFRASNDLLKRYGTWLRALQGDDHVAIAISGRQFKIDDWDSVTGYHFARVMEAWVSCLHAHHPAALVFAEDVKPDTFKKYQAVLVVDQTVEMEPTLAAALKNAQTSGTKIFVDSTCRPELVKAYTPLGIAFDKFAKDTHPASDDSAYYRFPQYVKANLPALHQALDHVAPLVAQIENPEVLASQRKSGNGKFLFVVNNTTPPFDPGQIWRTTLLIASRWPVIEKVGLTTPSPAVYDVLAMKKVAPQANVLTADLRDLPMRIYAQLPAAIGSVALRGPGTAEAGSAFKWWTQVRDSGGKPIESAIPVRIRLLAPDGSALREEFLSSDVKGVGGEFVIPLNTPGTLTLEADELFSGQSARLTIGAKATTLPIAPDKKLAVANADVSGRAVSTDIAPSVDDFGPHLRDAAVSSDGKITVLNAHNWNENLYGLDCATGKTVWRQKVGQYFTFAPQTVSDGFVVQGFDYNSAEGYHLYLGDETGHLARRFALYGLPQRLPHRFVPGLLNDRDDPIDNFAAPGDGSWIASAGDLGLIVWSRMGEVLWQQDWWKTGRHTARLDAPDTGTLLVAESGAGAKVAAYGAKTGKVQWKLDLAPTGVVQKIVHSADGNTVALLTDYGGGRVYLVRNGKLLSTLVTSGLDIAMAPDGGSVAVITGNQLKLYGVEDGLHWIFSGDDVLRSPRFAPDSKRIAVGSELGTVYVVDTGAGKVLYQRDNDALTVPAWLPGGDLLLSNWMGKVTRLDTAYKAKWSTLLRPGAVDVAAPPTKTDTTPVIRAAGWGNALPQPLPLTPNLLTETKALITFSGGASNVQFNQPTVALADGKPDAPAQPWLNWSDVNWFAEGFPQTAIVLDTFRTQMRVHAITFVEDPAHPESWLRDANLEYWDAEHEKWVYVQPLLSNSAIHTHQLATPIESAKLRVTLPRSMFSNIRLGEIVLHGETLGSSHPDVIAQRPRATLFDESDEVNDVYPYRDRYSLQFEGAYSGGRFLKINADQTIGPNFRPPFGETWPNWDFEIAENPKPGQYRYLQWAWKALGPGNAGATLRFSGSDGAVRLYAGQPSDQDYIPAHKVGESVPTEWHTVRVDLWDIFKKPAHIQALYLSTKGSAVGFDQIVLGRTPADLPPEKP